MAQPLPTDKEPLADPGTGLAKAVWYRYWRDVQARIEAAATEAQSDAEAAAAAALAAAYATQAEQETGTAVDKIVSPGRQHFHASASKVWAKFGVTANVLASYNITSITDSGTGDATVTIATDFSGDHWAATLKTLVGATGGSSIDGQAAGTLGVISWVTTTGAAVDPTSWFVSGLGDL